jgi:hypothetical protein
VAESGAPATEQRARRRHGCGTIRLTRLSLTTAPRTYFAWIHDVSEHGIGLDVVAPVAIGAEFVFTLKFGIRAKIRLYAQVVHATPIGHFYRLGCRFTLPLRPATLATLCGTSAERSAKSRRERQSDNMD